MIRIIGILILILLLNNCQEVDFTIKRGPRYKVGNVIIKPTLPCNSLRAVNVKDKGAKGDGISNDTKAIQAAADTGKPICFPPGTYLIDKTINLKNDVYGKGKIIASQFVAFNVKADSVSIKGITIESTYRTGNTAPFSVIVDSVGYFEMTNTTLINNRFRHVNREEKHLKSLNLSQNTIKADFSPFLRFTVQNDVIAIRGIDGVNVSRNLFICKNVNRVFKIADIINKKFPDTLKVSPYNSKNIVITDNIVDAKSDSSKQIIDLYNGCQNVSIQYNKMEAIGYSSIVENKTGSETDFTQNTIIENNILMSDHSILAFQGSWGALTPSHESGFQNVKISNNYLEGLSPFHKNHRYRGLIRVRYYHQVDVTQNEIVFNKAENRMAASFYPNKEVNFSFNSIKNGVLQFTLANKNHNGSPFDAKEEKITIKLNQMENAFYANGYGIITIKNVGQAQASLDVLHNVFSQSPSKKNPTILLDHVVFDSVSIIGNKVDKNSEKYLGGVVTKNNNTITTYNESLNSWN